MVGGSYVLPVNHTINAMALSSTAMPPYSDAYAGTTLLLKDKSIITGRYAENAAYNPSLPPLQAALNLLHLRWLDTDSIVDAAFARVAGHGQAAHAEVLWQSFDTPKLRIVAVSK